MSGTLFPFRSYFPCGTNAWSHVAFDQWWNWLRWRGYVG